MSTKVKAIPEGYHSITPALIVKNGMDGPNGKIGHAELKIGDSIIMLTDEFPEMKCLSPQSIGGSPVSMFLYVEDVDTIFNKAVSAGSRVLDPVKDQFWGDRHGRLEDPFGHVWSISTHKEDLSPAELKKAAEAAFAEMSKNVKE